MKIEQGVVSFNAALSACGNASEWQLGSAAYLYELGSVIMYDVNICLLLVGHRNLCSESILPLGMCEAMF